MICLRPLGSRSRARHGKRDLHGGIQRSLKSGHRRRIRRGDNFRRQKRPFRKRGVLYQRARINRRRGQLRQRINQTYDCKALRMNSAGL